MLLILYMLWSATNNLESGTVSYEIVVIIVHQVAKECQKECRRAALQSQKAAKEASVRARRLSKEVMVYWKRFDKVEKEHRKRAEKEAHEQRKMDLELREVNPNFQLFCSYISDCETRKEPESCSLIPLYSGTSVI